MDYVLIDEIRAEYQIPPFFSNDSLNRYVAEGKGVFERLVPGVDFDEDTTARMLLKNYVFYSYNHRTNEFFENFSELILMWQVGADVN